MARIERAQRVAAYQSRAAKVVRCLVVVSVVAALLVWTGSVLASGPRWVAGPVYFNPAAKGQALTWPGGLVSYYTDLGTLGSSVNESQADALVAAAAAVWNSVPTAAISITKGGNLAEDVNSSNVTPNQIVGTGATFPTDVQPNSSKPVAIVYDADGSVINDMLGPGASDATNCTQSGVITNVDNLTVAGKIAHALIVIDGLCATDTAHQTLLKYELIRAFGQVLGLDWSQVNESMFLSHNASSNAIAGWPLMHGIEYLCTGSSTNCESNMTTLRLDDIAGVNRLYPVTSSNISSFSGASPAKQLTAANTISVQGTLAFKTGQGMQGVNIELVPLVSGTPQVQYTVSAVTGVFFHANAGNPVSGPTDELGNQLDIYGTDDQTMEGFFDLSGVPLPPGTTVSDYQISFEAVSAGYTGGQSVGPYTTAQVTPSGTMPTMTLPQLQAGSPLSLGTITIEDSASENHGNDGTETAPAAITANGEWLGRLAGYGHTSWVELPIKANRVFTLEAAALDASGLGTEDKAALVLGFWNASDPAGSLPELGQEQAFNGDGVGLTSLTGYNGQSGEVRLAVADMRGDGRPDYVYRARLLYADSVQPARIHSAGGAITIQGTGFRSTSTVWVNSVQAQVTSVSSTEITAVAPASAGVVGVVPVEVDDSQTLGSTVIEDGLSYDAYGSDGIQTIIAPGGTVASGVPTPFQVLVVSGDGVTPASNVSVAYSVTSGSATLGCGSASCAVLTDGAGHATLTITPVSGAGLTKVSAALSNGQSVLAQFTAGTPPSLAATNSTLYVAAGGQVIWIPVALMQSGNAPVSGAGVNWSGGGSGVSVPSTSSMTSSSGLAQIAVVVGPMSTGASTPVYACEAQSPATCATFTANAVDGTLAQLAGTSGTAQVLSAGTAPAPVTMRVTDAAGHPLAGATVSFYELLQTWQASCPSTGRCPTPETLGTQTVTVASDTNGMVSLTPLADLTQPTTLTVNASTGNTASVVFQIVEHP